MKISGEYFRRAIPAAALAGLLLACAPAMHAAGTGGAAGNGRAAGDGKSSADQDPAAALQAKLRGSQYQNVQVSVDKEGIATLSGTVPLYKNKKDADRIARKVKGVEAVRNDIQVAGGVPDSEIEKKLGPQLAYSRQGYDNVFDAIGLHVQNGVVTLSGHAHDYPNRDAAVALAGSTPGVKQVIDNIQVDPVSQMDWGIRRAVRRAIYGYPALQRYAINPVQPIRISVQNGHVELYGTVDSQQDKQLAFMRARQVPGTFRVKDYIQVEGQPAGKQESESQQK